MSVIATTGNHPRHAYLVASLEKAGILSGWVREVRENFVPSAPPELSEEMAALFDRHFQLREEAEASFFGGAKPSHTTILETSHETLNSDATIQFLASQRPKLVLSYGCHKLSAGLREAVGCRFWNTHGGLSPEYRGVITHFWPSYMLEPQMTGMTLHETTDDLDGGAIIHQTDAVLEAGDGLHALAARTVRAYADQLAALLPEVLDRPDLPEGIRQTSPGKLWHSSDWRPEHLNLIYETHKDRIVDLVLEGKIEGRKPNLKSVLA